MEILTGLAGGFDVLFGVLIGVSSVMLLSEDVAGPASIAAIVWARFGVLLIVAGIGIFAKRGWGVCWD